jgi:hypothetical protein
MENEEKETEMPNFSLLSTLRMLSDRKGRTLVSDIFNNELGLCLNEGYKQARKIISEVINQFKRLVFYVN